MARRQWRAPLRVGRDARRQRRRCVCRVPGSCVDPALSACADPDRAERPRLRRVARSAPAGQGALRRVSRRPISHGHRDAPGVRAPAADRTGARNARSEPSQSGVCELSSRILGPATTRSVHDARARCAPALAVFRVRRLSGRHTLSS